MEDKLLAMFFEPQRWEVAIEKGVGKDINRAYLYQLTKEEVRAEIYMRMKAGEYRDEGWKLFGLLRKFLKDNNVDIKAKQKEWAEAKRLRTGK
jgi:hypothetical protein